jgi:hypothetical protein
MTKDNTNPNKDPKTVGDDTSKWIQLQDHRPMYLPDECEKMAIRGYLLGTMEMNPSNKNKKENISIEEQFWVALVLQLTAPCKLRSPEGDIRTYEANTQCLIGGADQASLYGRADHPTIAFEVELKPIRQLALGGGRKMWLFEKRVNPITRDRVKHALEFFEGRAITTFTDSSNGHQSLPANNSAHPALPQHSPETT